MHGNNIKEIQKKIDRYKIDQEKKNTAPAVKSLSSSNIVFNIAIELVAGTMVGVIIGLFFDKTFDSKPIFLIICLLLSTAATFKSILNKYIKK